MLFPAAGEYRKYFETAGFTDLQERYVRPQWYHRKGEFGMAISGKKPAPGRSPADDGSPPTEQAEAEKMTFGRSLQLFWRVLLGSLAGFVFIPAALLGYLRNAFRRTEPVPEEYRERLNGYQVFALLAVVALLVALAWWIFS